MPRVRDTTGIAGVSSIVPASQALAFSADADARRCGDNVSDADAARGERAGCRRSRYGTFATATLAGETGVPAG